MNQNPIEELRRMETPVTEEGWTSIVNDRRYARKFGHKGGLSPKGRAALIAGAAAVLITVPILVKTLTHSEKETAQANVPTTETVTIPSTTETVETTHTKTVVATTAGAAKAERGTITAVTAARASDVPAATPASSHADAPDVAITQPNIKSSASDAKVSFDKTTPTSPIVTVNTKQQVDNPSVTKQKANVSTPVQEDVNDDIVMRSAEEEPVAETEQFFIPSAFTPNGDGLNDLFVVKANFVPRSFELTVLNRAGEPMFQTRDINIGWDGHFHGKLLPQGVYVCIIKYKDSEGKEHKQQGQVLLIP